MSRVKQFLRIYSKELRSIISKTKQIVKSQVPSHMPTMTVRKLFCVHSLPDPPNQAYTCCCSSVYPEQAPTWGNLGCFTSSTRCRSPSVGAAICHTLPTQVLHTKTVLLQKDCTDSMEALHELEKNSFFFVSLISKQSRKTYWGWQSMAKNMEILSAFLFPCCCMPY